MRVRDGSLARMAHVLSPAAHAKLTAELEDLTTRGRIEIARAIERARELGDLSENGDYQAAKDQQGMMEGRIRQLQAILKDAEIAEASDSGAVSPGCVVTIVYEGDSDDDERGTADRAHRRSVSPAREIPQDLSQDLRRRRLGRVCFA